MLSTSQKRAKERREKDQQVKLATAELRQHIVLVEQNRQILLTHISRHREPRGLT